MQVIVQVDETNGTTLRECSFTVEARLAEVVVGVLQFQEQDFKLVCYQDGTGLTILSVNGKPLEKHTAYHSLSADGVTPAVHGTMRITTGPEEFQNWTALLEVAASPSSVAAFMALEILTRDFGDTLNEAYSDKQEARDSCTERAKQLRFALTKEERLAHALELEQLRLQSLARKTGVQIKN